MTAQTRVNAGVPTGGQFASHDRAEGAELNPDMPNWRLSDGTCLWMDGNGELHRDGGPAAIRPGGNTRQEEWWQHGKLHRVDGPAIERDDRLEQWYLNGERHRDGGPATTLPNGDEMWFRHGKLHREDGPAVKRRKGENEWWIDGVQIGKPE